MNKKAHIFIGLCILCAMGFIGSVVMIFRVAPIDPNMGLSQKIFYFHVPCAWSMFLAVLMSALGGGLFLFKDRRWGDALCASAAELAVLFGVLVLITGPLWARVAWGHYWQWDVRLTTVLVLFLCFCGVLLARRYGGPAAGRLSAGLALFGAADVPLVYISVKLWRTIHPSTTVVSTLPSEMMAAFFTSLATFTVLFVLLLWIRLNLERARAAQDELIVALSERPPIARARTELEGQP